MATTGLPASYLALNNLTAKTPMLVVSIEGLGTLISSGLISSTLVYGSPGAFYGGAGLVYGGLIPYTGYKQLIDLDKSSVTLQQRLEPEQGKASVSNLSIAFVDTDQFMTQLVAPGILITDILLAQITVRLGFTQSAFPEGYFKIFKGYVSGISAGPGLINIQISDANVKARTALFYTATTETVGAITANAWIFTVQSNSGFNKQITQLGDTPFAYDDHVTNYVQIDDEWIICEPIVQENERYTANIQGIVYTAKPDHGTDISITYIGGGTAGSEVVTVVDSDITVEIEVGVSTPATVFLALSREEDAVDLVTFYTLYPTIATPLSAQAQTFLSITNYRVLSKQGIVYFEQPGVTGTTIVYLNDGTAGAETATVAGSVITVHMQTGLSTATGIYVALLDNAVQVFSLVRAIILPRGESIAQTAFGSTAFTVGVPGSQFGVVERGARNTIAAIHDDNTDVAAGIQVGDPVNPENAMDIALKLYLSGTNGTWIKKIALNSIGAIPDSDPFSPTSNILQLEAGLNAIDDYNLQLGDTLFIYDTATPSQNGLPYVVTRISSNTLGTNNLVFIDTQLNKESTTSATISIRSQYDTYPINAGLALKPTDIDISGHNYVKNTFLGNDFNDLIFFITGQESSGKEFIQTEVYYPIGAYGLTRYGLLSVGYNSPPIANQNVVTLDDTNILNPESIQPVRAINNRNFFNEVDFEYGVDDAGNFNKVLNIVSSGSLSRYGGYVSALPVKSRGLYAGYDQDLLRKYGVFLLNKYAYGAVMMTVKVNWQAGSVIEAGDLCILDDSNGVLQISNFITGQRGLGRQLYKIIDRSFDFKAGNVTLMLQGNAGSAVTDRFATISPSSYTDNGCTTTSLIIKDSFGALFPGDEAQKWANYTGLPIHVHSDDYSFSEVVTLTGISDTNNYLLTCTPLSVAPPADYIIDIDDYPTTNNTATNAIYKTMHVYLSPTVTVVTGVDQRNFTVGAGDIGKFLVGAIVEVHSTDYSIASGELTVTMVTGVTVTVDAPLGFTPSAGQLVDFIGFADGGQAYRLI